MTRSTGCRAERTNERPDQEAGGRAAALVRQDLDIGEPGGVIDGDMEEVVADAFAAAAPVAGDAVADAVEAGQLLDVEMEEFTGPVALVAPHRLGSARLFSVRVPCRSSQPATVERAS